MLMATVLSLAMMPKILHKKIFQESNINWWWFQPTIHILSTSKSDYLGNQLVEKAYFYNNKLMIK